LLAVPGALGAEPLPVFVTSVGGVVVVWGCRPPDFGLPPLPSPPPLWPFPPVTPREPPTAVAPPAELEAIWPDAVLGGALVPPADAFGVGELSSTLPATVKSRPVGQTLKETSPTRVTKTIAAPARRAPDAPIPTMKLSGVLFFDVLVAA